MTRPSFDEWALGLARSYSERGTCPRRKTGAVGFDRYNRIVGFGMNGVPRGIDHCTDYPCPGAGDPSGDTSRCRAIHDICNMILNSKNAFDIEVIYTTTFPCFHCSLLAANLPNLKRIVYMDDYPGDERGFEIFKQRRIQTIKHTVIKTQEAT